MFNHSRTDAADEGHLHTLHCFYPMASLFSCMVLEMAAMDSRSIRDAGGEEAGFQRASSTATCRVLVLKPSRPPTTTGAQRIPSEIVPAWAERA